MSATRYAIRREAATFCRYSSTCPSDRICQPLEIRKGIEPCRVAIPPAWLDGVPPDPVDPVDLETPLMIRHLRPFDAAENVRLSAARRAGTMPTHRLEREIAFGTVIPGDRKLVSDHLQVFRAKRCSHCTGEESRYSPPLQVVTFRLQISCKLFLASQNESHYTNPYHSHRK